MDNKNNVNVYSKERLKKEHPEIFEEIIKMNEMIANAKEEPTEQCENHKEHNFTFMLTGDSKEEALFYFQCEHCQEVIVEKHVRAAENPKRKIQLLKNN